MHKNLFSQKTSLISSYLSGFVHFLCTRNEKFACSDRYRKRVCCAPPRRESNRVDNLNVDRISQSNLFVMYHDMGYFSLRKKPIVIAVRCSYCNARLHTDKWLYLIDETPNTELDKMWVEESTSLSADVHVYLYIHRI